MKKIILFVAVFCFSGCCDFSKAHKVLVTFCDNRPPRIVTVYGCENDYPDLHIIQGRDYPVPKWNGLLNVCELNLIN